MEKTSNLWRVLQILLKIKSRPGISADELAEYAEISTRSVYRYIRILRMADIPIIADHGYRLSRDFYLPNLKLNLSEALSLILAAVGFKKMSGDLMSGSVNAAMDKIMASLPASLREISEKIPENFLIGRRAPVNYANYRRVFNLVKEAIDKRKSLQLEYHSFNSKRPDKRLIDPYGIVFRAGFCYLVGYCHKRRKILLFRIDRVVSARRSKESFTYPNGFSLSGYMADAWRVSRGQLQNVKIKFSGGAARLVKEAKWHSSQKIIVADDNSATVAYRISGLREICAWLLCFGAEAEVLQPADLRRLVRETAAAAARVNR